MSSRKQLVNSMMVADHLGVTRSAVSNWIARGVLPKNLHPLDNGSGFVPLWPESKLAEFAAWYGARKNTQQLRPRKVLWSFTSADAEKAAGRNITHEEAERIRKAIGFSTAAEACEDTVFQVCGGDAPDDEKDEDDEDLDGLADVPSHRNDLGDWCPHGADGDGARTADGTCPDYCHEADVLVGFNAGDRELPESTDLPRELWPPYMLANAEDEEKEVEE